MVDARFIAALNEGGPTQYETGQRLCNRMYDCILNSRSMHMLREEDAISAVGSIYLQLIEDAGYDLIGVTECLTAARRMAEQQRATG